MGSVRKSIGYSTLNGWTGVVFQLVSTVVVARILTPEQTGVFAVAAVFASLASTFRDFGVGEYLIQERELTDDAIRAATTVNIAVSWAMGVLLFLLAPWIAQFYRNPGVGEVMRVMAFSFLLIPFGAVTMAWFRRELDFRPLVLANLASSTVSLVVVLVMALRGHGYMSLAWSSLAGVAVTVLVSMWCRPASFPRWPGLRGVRKVVDFGKFASGIYIFGQLGRGAPEMIIGRVQDMASVGMFSRANGMVEIFHRLVMRSIMPVCLPYFAQGMREHGSPRKGLLRTMSLLSAVGWPFLLFVGLAAYPAIRLMYGIQWVDAVPLSRILVTVAAVELVYYPAKEAMLAQGKARESNTLQVIMQTLRVAGLFGAIPWGLPGAAWGLLVAVVLGALLSHLYLARHVGLTVGDVARALLPSLGVALLSTAPMSAWLLLMPVDESNFVRVGVAGGLACALAWVLAVRVCRHPIGDELQRVQQLVLRRRNR